MDFIEAVWPAPTRVRAMTTTRQGGVSRTPYASFNLGDHVADDPLAVTRNRELLKTTLQLPSEPQWLRQVHGCNVVSAEQLESGSEADAVCARQPGMVCAVLTADCLPLLICDCQGRQICAVHAGWRGLAAGVVEAAIEKLDALPEELLVWLGPAIGPKAFEVGAEVVKAFTDDMDDAGHAFIYQGSGHWMADIYALARLRLARLGVGYVGGGNYCTVTDEQHFYSYRRDGVTGRMASLIWLEPEERT